MIFKVVLRFHSYRSSDGCVSIEVVVDVQRTLLGSSGSWKNILMPESCDVVATESISFEMAPVYGHVGVELSGLAANLDGVDVEHDGNDSERSFSMVNGGCLTTVVEGVSLLRCRT